MPVDAALRHDALMIVYGLHIGGGTIAVVAGTIAAFAKKGERLHRLAGTVFFVSMLVMAVFAGVLALVVPDRPQIAGAALTIYLLFTAWMTVRRPEATIGRSERIALAAILCLGALLAVPVLRSLTGGAGPKGPLLVASYTVTAVAAIATIGDGRLVIAGGIAGAARVARHLWRMLTAMTFAFGSAFTNGVPRLLPGPFHVPPILFAPMLLPLGLLVFWMIRVRLTRWQATPAPA